MSDFTLEAYVEPDALFAANQRHDAELRSMHIDQHTSIRPAWNQGLIMRRGKLTDKKIAAYEKAGYYSPEFKEARRTLQQIRARRRTDRDGNFLKSSSGSLIYAPK